MSRGAPDICPKAKAFLAEVDRRRMMNLRRVVHAMAAPAVKTFCREAKMEYANAMARLDGRRRITEDIARNIEARLALPFGELDR